MSDMLPPSQGTIPSGASIGAAVTLDWNLPAGTSEQYDCPICFDGTPKRELLAAASPLVGRRVVVRCENCECVFVPNLPEVPYDTFPSEFFQLYVEQGASIDLMVEPLFVVPTTSVRRYLEVGCAFGFGVDFATHALGWQATGLEPSELGKLGREVLGIDLQAAYLDDQTPIDEPYDLVFSSEVLEHVRNPRAFLSAAVRALAPDGVLMLTTPNAEHLTADRSVFSQVSILSYPLHCILYARSTLERVLREAGLPYVHIVERQDTLIAIASKTQLSPIDAKLDRHLLRTYLQKRFAQLPKATPAATGFAYRLFKEAVNSGDYADAAAILLSLQAELTERFGSEVGKLEEASTALLGAKTLAEAASLVPFNLCGCLYFRGMLELNYHGNPARAVKLFDAARETGAALRKLLWTLGVDDGETEDLVCQAARHSAIAAARLIVEISPTIDATPTAASPPPSSIVGYIDVVDDNGVAYGWAYDASDGFRVLDIDFYVDDQYVLTQRADTFRGDLAQLGYGGGAHGFAVDLASFLSEGDEHVVSARACDVALEPAQLRCRLAHRQAAEVVDEAPVATSALVHVVGSVADLRVKATAARRLALVACHTDGGRIFQYHRLLLGDMRAQGFATVLVHNGDTHVELFADATRDLADLVIVRDNAGMDFSAWVSALAHVEIELDTLDELVFMNDSVVGPLFPLEEAMTKMSASPCDFWGMTDSWQFAYHLQSYFLCFKHSALQSDALGEFLRSYPHPTSKDAIIRCGEIGLSRTLLEAGLRAGVYCPYEQVAARWLLTLPARLDQLQGAPEVAIGLGSMSISSFAERAAAHISAVSAYLRTGQPVNATHFFWDTLIREFRFPFLKKELLLRNPMSVPNLGDIGGLLAHTDFPLESIRELHVHTPGSLAPALPIHPSQSRADASRSDNDAGEGTAQTDVDSQRLKRLVGRTKAARREG
jgi:SAM-dependent methyltransferase